MLSALVLAACSVFNDDEEVASGAPPSDPPAGVSGTLSGTAAVGASVVGGTVDVRCAGGPALQATTEANGNWSVMLAGHTLPCAVQVSGGGLPSGQVLVSVAVQLGTVNVTPLTHLVVANMVGADPTAWFVGLNTAAYTAITQAAVNTAIGNVRAALALPALQGLDPITAAFLAQAGNTMDDILEALADALAAASMTWGQLVAAAQAGGNFGAALGSLPSQLATAYNSRGGGGAFASIGLHSGFTPPFDSVTKLVGTYTVGIYRAPTNRADLLGPATLVVSESGGIRSMELKKPDGTRVSYIDNDPARGPVPDLRFQFYSFGGDAKITGIAALGLFDLLNTDFYGNGLITGSAGGFGEVGFRNGVAHYGSSVPAVFNALQGTWSGPQRALTCGRPNVTVTITSAGRVTVAGVPNLRCGATETIEATWDGNDDIVVPHQEPGFSGYKIALDSAKIGGSQLQGGIFIYVNTLDSPTEVYYVKTTMAGGAGDIDVNNPTKNPGGSGGGSGTAGSLTVGGGAASTAPLFGGPVPTTFTPTVLPSGSTMPLQWKQSELFFVSVADNVVHLYYNNGQWSATRTNVNSQGVTIDLANRRVTFSNTTLAPAVFASGNVILNGTLTW